MPKLITLYIRNVAIGFALSAAFVALLMAVDVAGLRHLVLGSSSWMLALFMLWFMHGIVFAGVQFAWAIMALADPAQPRGPRGGMGIPALQPAPVRVEKRRDHQTTVRT